MTADECEHRKMARFGDWFVCQNPECLEEIPAAVILGGGDVA